MKVLFMGTPEFSVNILEGLIDNYDVVGVVSQPDREVGRKRILTPTPVKEVALNHNIKVIQPIKIRKEYEDVLSLEPDLIVTCAYGQIIPKEILDYPKYGCINVHASLLPKYRGGAPIHRAIMNGDAVTGITIMYMDEGMDTGDMISKKEVVIEDDDNLETLSNKLSIVGKDLLLETLPSIIDGTCERVKQNDEEVSFAYNVKSEEEHIDFNKTSNDINNLVRALSPMIGAYFLLNGERFNVYKCRIGTNKHEDIGIIKNIYKDGIGISTGDGEIILEEIQPFGKKKMTAASYLNGIDKNSLIGKVLE